MSCRQRRVIAALGLLCCACACRMSDPARERLGKIFYVEGAGSWGIGAESVREGFADCGYRGDFEVFGWSYSFNPFLDQLDLFGSARAAGAKLAERISAYKAQYPGATVHIVALSAGTGVSVWACEQLDGRFAVDNLVLLGSSLSYDYDLTRALTHIRGRVYNYHSDADAVLVAVPALGTIDRRVGVLPAGRAGLRMRREYRDRVVNTAWTRHWDGFGWGGGHTDCTRRLFVREEIARHLLDPRDLDIMVY